MLCTLLAWPPQGLAKLQKTQKDVDVLVEEAKIKAVEVEKKVAGADAFAEQVSLPESSKLLHPFACSPDAPCQTDLLSSWRDMTLCILCCDCPPAYQSSHKVVKKASNLQQ